MELNQPKTLTRRTLLGGTASVAAGVALSPAVSLLSRTEALLARGTISRGGTPRILQPTGLDHLDPTTNTYPAGFLISLVYGQLFKWARPPLSERGALVPEAYMASAVEMPDRTTAIVKLRENIRFHNLDPVHGRRLRADDVVATWERIKDPAIESIRTIQQRPVHVPTVVDNLTVQFTFDHPYAPFFNYLADVWQSIIAREAIEKGSDWLKQNPVGSGPFELLMLNLGVEAVLRAHRLPWWSPWAAREPAPYFDRIVMPIIPDDLSKQTIAFLGGQLDHAAIQEANWGDVEADGRFGWRRYAAQDMNYMRIQTGLPPTNDLRVRQALSMGFSRGAVVRKAFGGHARTTGPIPTSRVPWGLRTSDLPSHRFNGQESRMLLRAAGFDNGVDLVSLVPDQDNFQTEYISAITAQLKRVGIRLNEKRLEYGQYLETARLGKTDPEAAGWHINMHWGNRYNDPNGYLNEYRTDELGSRNYGGWGSADLDTRIESAARELDVDERVKAVHGIERKIAEQAWTPGLVLPIHMEAWNAKLQYMAVGPEWFQGHRSFIDASFSA